MTKKGKQASPFEVIGTYAMPATIIRLASVPAPYGPPPYRVVEVVTSERAERARLLAAEKELRDFEKRYGAAWCERSLKEACGAVREIREKLQDRRRELETSLAK